MTSQVEAGCPMTTRAHDEALRRFKRTMRRHEKRAKAMGYTAFAAPKLRRARVSNGAKDDFAHSAWEYRHSHLFGSWRRFATQDNRIAHLYERAAAAVARYRSDVAAADAASRARVCPACGRDPEATEKRLAFGGTSHPRTLTVGGHGIDCPNDPHQAIMARLVR